MKHNLITTSVHEVSEIRVTKDGIESGGRDITWLEIEFRNKQGERLFNVTAFADDKEIMVIKMEGKKCLSLSL
jgi:hypothetical protein